MDVFKLFKEKYKYFLALVLLGVFFLTFTPTEEIVEDTLVVSDVSQIENELAEILGSISGVGRVEIMLTMDESFEKIYAYDTDISNDDIKSEVVLVGNGPITIKTVYPKFRGALVVCDGADDPKIHLEIIRAIKSLCKISSENIEVIKMKG